MGVMVVRNPFDMIATRCKEIGAVLNYLKHPQNEKLIPITSVNCSKTRPIIPNCRGRINKISNFQKTVDRESQERQNTPNLVEKVVTYLCGVRKKIYKNIWSRKSKHRFLVEKMETYLNGVE